MENNTTAKQQAAETATPMKTYSVIQRNPNSWNASTGIHEIARECGHKHKTVVAALRCLRTLAPNSEFGYFGRIEDNSAQKDVGDDAIYKAEIEIQNR